MPAVQMNTRLDEHVKKCGDTALEQAGFTPSQTVRALWTFAAAHIHDPQAIKKLFKKLEVEVDPDREAHITEKKVALSKVSQLQEDLKTKLGFDPWAKTDNAPYEQLREEALLSRWEERGLL